MKTTLHSIRLSIKFPEFNLKEKDKEIYNKHKGTIISNIIIKNYIDFNPTFTVVKDELFIEFDMHKCPEYDIVRSFFFFDIKKKDILEEMKNYKPKIESVPNHEN